MMILARGLQILTTACVWILKQQIVEAVYAENIPTFTLTLQSETLSSNNNGPLSGYLQSLGEDVRSFIGTYVQKNLKKMHEQYEYSHLSLRAKELSSSWEHQSQSSLSIVFEGMIFFDTINVPEYYDIKLLLLDAFTNFDDKQIILNMIHISTDDFFKNVNDVLFSFGEVMVLPQKDNDNHHRDSDRDRVSSANSVRTSSTKDSNIIDSWISSSNQTITTLAGGCVGILSALLLSSCYCLFATKHKKHRHSLKLNDDKSNYIDNDNDNDSTLKLSIQNDGSRSFTSPDKSSSEEEGVIYGRSNDDDFDDKSEISEFQYSLKSLESGDLSVFTYGQAFAPDNLRSMVADSKVSKEKSGKVMPATPMVETNGALSNMEVSFHDDFESPRSQITQPSVFVQDSTTTPQLGYYNHARYPTPPSPKYQYNNNYAQQHSTPKLVRPSCSTNDNTLSTHPTPLRSNKTTDNGKSHERSNTLTSLGINSVIEEDSHENGSSSANSSSKSNDDSAANESRSSLSILEGVLGETEFI